MLPIILLLAAPAWTIQEPEWTPIEQLTPSGTTTFGFGASPVFDGTTLAAATTSSTTSGPYSGSVILYEQVLGAWTQVDELLPAPGNRITPQTPAYRFGHGLDLDDDRLAVGDPEFAKLIDEAHGKVSIFVRDAGGWSLEGELLAPDAMPGDRFGESVALDGPRLIVGAPGDDNILGVDTGATYVYERIGFDWVLQQKLVGENPAVRQAGRLLDFRGGVLVCGGLFHVDVYEQAPSGWAQEDSLQPYVSNFFLSRIDQVDLDGGTLAISSDRAPSSNDPDPGRIYVYQRTGGVFVLDQEIRDPLGAPGYTFGSAIELVGGRLLATSFISLARRCHVFEREPGGEFELGRSLVPPYPASDGGFLQPVVSGDVAFVTGTSGSGSMFRFELWPDIGTTVCNSLANSTGAPTELAVLGSPDLTEAAFQLSVRDLPPNEFGFFISGPNLAPVPLFAGTLCIGSPIGRHLDAVLGSGAEGIAWRDQDLTSVPIPSAPFLTALVPGDQWLFQYWHRDGATANFSNAVEVVFQ